MFLRESIAANSPEGKFQFRLRQNKGNFPSAYDTTSGQYGDLTIYFPAWAWSTAILPYVEQGNLFNAMGLGSVTSGSWTYGASGFTVVDNNTGPYGPAPVPTFGTPFAYPSTYVSDNYGYPVPTPNSMTQTPLPIFRCPADTGPVLNPLKLNYPTCNYRAVTGPNGSLYGSDMGGVMFQNSKIRFTDITDGTSNTVVIGECMYNALSGKEAAIWPGMTGCRMNPATQLFSVFLSDVMWWLDNQTSEINGTAPEAFSSYHDPGGRISFSPTARCASGQPMPATRTFSCTWPAAMTAWSSNPISNSEVLRSFLCLGCPGKQSS